jgi:mycothiol system anti-sigma-R factor
VYLHVRLYVQEPGETTMINEPFSQQPKSPLAQARQPLSPYDPFGDINPAAAADCSAMLKRLYNFLDGELTDERRLKMQTHLDDCPTCFSAFGFEAELRQVIARKTYSEVPNHLAEKIRMSICLPSQSTDPGPIGLNG